MEHDIGTLISALGPRAKILSDFSSFNLSDGTNKVKTQKLTNLT